MHIFIVFLNALKVFLCIILYEENWWIIVRKLVYLYAYLWRLENINVFVMKILIIGAGCKYPAFCFRVCGIVSRPESACYICQRYSLIRNEKGSLERRGANLQTTGESLTQGKYPCPIQKLCNDVYDIQKYV